MLPLWEASALSPKPSTVTDDTELRKWLKEPSRRLRVTSPGRSRTKDITGYKAGGTKSAVVLGHQPSAGSHFNTTGHTQPRQVNLEHNRSTGAYHGLEDAMWSAASNPEYQRAVIELGNLKTTYSSSLAKQLLGVIEKNGWVTFPDLGRSSSLTPRPRRFRAAAVDALGRDGR